MRIHELEQELRRAGFRLDHVRRHRVYRHQDTGRTLIVAAHRGHEIRPGTVQAIRRDMQRAQAQQTARCPLEHLT